MKLIAQNIPDLNGLFSCNPANNQGCGPSPFPGKISGSANFTQLGNIISALLNIAFYLVMFITFYYLVWGAFQYITASGKKEELAKARARITWALIGLLVVMISFLVAKYAGFIFPSKGGLPF